MIGILYLLAAIWLTLSIIWTWLVPPPSTPYTMAIVSLLVIILIVVLYYVGPAALSH